MTILMWALAVSTLAIDSLTKWWATAALTGQGVTAIPGLLELRLTFNDGMALGIMSGGGIAIILLPLAVIGAGYFILRRYEPTLFVRTACGLILGGFLGNFIERLFKGYVVDMIYFPFMPWFVCNVADIVICAGVTMLAVSLLFRPKDWREKHAKDDPNCGE